MIGGVTRLGGLPGLLGRVTLPAGVAFCHVNVSRWGNPPTRGRFMLPKRAKSEPKQPNARHIGTATTCLSLEDISVEIFFAGFICLVSNAAIKMAIRKNLKVFKFQVML